MSRSGRELLVIAALLTGLLALALAGHPLVALAGAVSAAVAPWARPALARVPWAVVVVLLVIGAAAWAVRGDAGTAAGPLLAALAVQRRLARVGPADDRATLALAVLMLAFTATRTDHPGFLALVLAFAGLAPAALLEEGSRRRPLPLGLVAGLSLVSVALVPTLFVLLPRVGGARSAAGQAQTGFESELELGDLDVMVEDQAPVVRVRFRGEQPRPPIYLRGAALDRFDGRRWSTGTERSVRAIERRLDDAVLPVVPGTTEIVVDREPLAEGVLFTTGQVLRIAGDVPWVRQDEQGGLWLPGEPRRVRYVLHAAPPFDPTGVPPGIRLADAARAGLLEVPDVEGLRELSDRWAGDLVDPSAKVEAIRDGLLREYAYTRAPQDTTAEDPLPVFLFERKSGHCEYFASALAVLLRDQGVPARVVTGFAGGEYVAAGDYWLFRRSDAHAWVEAWLPERGWVGFDATPGPEVVLSPPASSQAIEVLDRLWYDGVLGYDLATQADAVVAAGRVVESALPAADPSGPPWLGLLLVGVGGGALAAGAWALLGRIARRLAGERAPRRPRGRVARAHERARRAIARRGWRIPASLPPVAAAGWLRERAGDAASPLERLAWLHYRVRYGREDDAALGVEAERLSAEIARIRPPGAYDDAGGGGGVASGGMTRVPNGAVS